MTPEQSLALVEYIAHLSVEDWDGIARDLRKLGFVPAGTYVFAPVPGPLTKCHDFTTSRLLAIADTIIRSDVWPFASGNGTVLLC